MLLLGDLDHGAGVQAGVTCGRAAATCHRQAPGGVDQQDELSVRHVRKGRADQYRLYARRPPESRRHAGLESGRGQLRCSGGSVNADAFATA